MIKGIRKDTLEKIALAAIEKCNISRDALAEELGISSMTVGKAVPLLEKAGLISQTREPVSRGRHAALLSPSERFAYLAVFMSADMMTVIAQSVTSANIATLRRPLNPALCCKDNVAAATRELFMMHELENKIAERAVIILSRKEDFNGLDIGENERYDATALVHSEIARRFPEENVLYASLSSGTLLPLIVSHGNVFYRDAARKIHSAPNDDVADRIAQLISSISVYSHFDRVILEGDKNEENQLLLSIKEALIGKYGISERELPLLTYHKGMSFMQKDLFDKLRKRHIERVCDSFFVEQ